MSVAAQFVVNSGASLESESKSEASQNSFWFLDDATRNGNGQFSWSQTEDSSCGPSQTINYYAYGQGQPRHGAATYPTETIWSGGYDQGATAVSHEANQMDWGGYSTGNYSTAEQLGGGASQEVSWCQETYNTTGSYYLSANVNPVSDFRGFGGFETGDWSQWPREVSPWTGISPWIMPAWLQSSGEVASSMYGVPCVKQEREEFELSQQNHRPVSTPVVYQVCLSFDFYRPFL